MNEIEMAKRTVRVIPHIVSTEQALRGLMPADADPKLVQAVGVGTAARYAADLLAATLPPNHPTMHALVEYISLSMGVICEVSEVDPEYVSKTADSIVTIITNQPDPEASPVETSTPAEPVQ